MPGGPSPAHWPLPGCRAGWLLDAYMNSKADDLGSLAARRVLEFNNMNSKAVDWFAVLDAVAPEITMQYRVNN